MATRGGLRIRNLLLLLVTLDTYCCARKLHHLTSTDWSICDSGIFKIEGVGLKPDHITRGTTAYFSVGAISGGAQAVGGGTIDMSVQLAGIAVYSHTDDLCSKTSCPVEPGSSFQINYSRHFPFYTPPGSYTMKLQGFSDSGEKLFCIRIGFHVHFSQDNAQLRGGESEQRQSVV
eukprot:jgi/Picsp_1/6644/NSC_03987-R1_md-2-related lipid recognition domain-containing protein